jgi:hypothetical protein
MPSSSRDEPQTVSRIGVVLVPRLASDEGPRSRGWSSRPIQVIGGSDSRIDGRAPIRRISLTLPVSIRHWLSWPGSPEGIPAALTAGRDPCGAAGAAGLDPFQQLDDAPSAALPETQLHGQGDAVIVGELIDHRRPHAEEFRSLRVAKDWEARSVESWQKGSLYLTRPMLATCTATRAELEETAREVFDVISEGKVKVEVRHTHPLADAAQVHRDLRGTAPRSRGSLRTHDSPPPGGPPASLCRITGSTTR